MTTLAIKYPPSLAASRYTTDLTGRAVDILISQGVDFTKDAPVELAFGDRERVVAGAQKMVQKWMIIFLTKTGSVQSDESFGTNFMTDLEQGRIRNDADVRASFGDAAARAKEIMTRSNASNPYADEQLDSATLQTFTITKTTLTLTVSLVSAAGAGATVILPIPLEVPS